VLRPGVREGTEGVPSGKAMGTEGERLIDDYLGQVRDLARRALPEDERVRLVTRLRDDIERERQGAGRGPAAVREILGRLGTPDAVVEEAASVGLPVGPDGEVLPPPFPGSEVLPGPAAPGFEATEDGFVGGFTAEPDWWRLTGQGGPPGYGSRPAVKEPERPAEPAEREPEPVRPRPRWLPGRRRAPQAPTEAVAEAVAEPGAAAVPLPARILPFWTESLAALLLVAGTVAGLFAIVAAGWVLAYYSRRLTRTQARIAALGPPLLTVGATSFWLWGRTHGKWGPALTDPRITPALHHEFPVMLRVAALASAAYLVWHINRGSRIG
jgi:hypothetical protein